MTLCKCGCGESSPVANRTDTGRGLIKDQPKRFLHGHHSRLDRGTSPHFVVSENRWRVHTRNRTPTAWSRIVMEDHLHRSLDIDEIVHHVNGDSTDDSIDNLVVMSRIEHIKAHNFLQN